MKMAETQVIYGEEIENSFVGRLFDWLFDWLFDDYFTQKINQFYVSHLCAFSMQKGLKIHYCLVIRF